MLWHYVLLQWCYITMSDKKNFHFCNFVCRDLSNNRLAGPVPDNGSFSLFTPIRFYADACCKTVMVLNAWYKSVMLIGDLPSAVLQITWIYVVRLLGSPALGLLHFLHHLHLCHHLQFLLLVILLPTTIVLVVSVGVFVAHVQCILPSCLVKFSPHFFWSGEWGFCSIHVWELSYLLLFLEVIFEEKEWCFHLIIQPNKVTPKFHILFWRVFCFFQLKSLLVFPATVTGLVLKVLKFIRNCNTVQLWINNGTDSPTKERKI